MTPGTPMTAPSRIARLEKALTTTGWLHPIECSNEHNEYGNCLDAAGSVVGWPDEGDRLAVHLRALRAALERSSRRYDPDDGQPCWCYGSAPTLRNRQHDDICRDLRAALLATDAGTEPKPFRSSVPEPEHEHTVACNFGWCDIDDGGLA